MGRARYMIQTARYCFRTWRNAPKVLALIGMIACFVIIYAVPFAENARALGEPLQITEVFIAMMNWRFTMLLFSTSILLLFGDLPLIESFTANSLTKGTRRGWITGQIIYVAIASLLLTCFVFLVSVLVCLPNIEYAVSFAQANRRN